MPESRRRPLTVEIRYPIGAKAEKDDVICDEVRYQDGWVILFRSDSEVCRYNQAHVVRVRVERGQLEAPSG